MIYDYVTDNSYEPGAHKISAASLILSSYDSEPISSASVLFRTVSQLRPGNATPSARPQTRIVGGQRGRPGGRLLAHAGPLC